MAIYSNSQIQTAIDDGRIICVPFNAQHLNPVSLDITLGYHYYRIERTNERTLYNPYSREDVERYFDGPYKAMPHGKWAALNGFKPLANIPLDHPIIALQPGERILASSHEFIGISAPGAANVSGRSSWTRNGIIVSADAGWIQPGYINRLTLTIHNLNERETIVLPVGERIAQVLFHDSTETDDSLDYKAKYHHGTDVDTIIKTWSPDMMLPRIYLDQRSLPRHLEGSSYE